MASVTAGLTVIWHSPNTQVTMRSDGSWIKTGHCRRCVNGLGHRRASGSSKATGVLLQRDRLTYDDELAPGEKTARRRAVRHREKAEVRRMITRGEE